jgi:hypothetical protein
VAKHAVFQGAPEDGLMGRDYGNVAPVQCISTDVKASEDIGPAVQIYALGKGKIILTCLNLLPNLKSDALAEKLLCNLLNYAESGLPVDLAPENPATSERLRFSEKEYEDCLKEFIAPRAAS